MTIMLNILSNVLKFGVGKKFFFFFFLISNKICQRGSIYLTKNTVKHFSMITPVSHMIEIILICGFLMLKNTFVSILKTTALLNIFLEIMIHFFQYCLIDRKFKSVFI